LKLLFIFYGITLVLSLAKDFAVFDLDFDLFFYTLIVFVMF